MTPAARLTALAIELVSLAALAAQFVVSNELTGGIGATLWMLTGFFAVLTNLLVTFTFATIARRTMPGAGWLGGLTLWIVIVAVVYHLMLARLWTPVGLAWWADQGLHSAVPALVVLWWLAFAPKAGLGLRHALLWLIWPGLYLVYALVRGAFTGAYPFPFVDVTALGYGAVAVNAAELLVAFFIGGLGVVGLAKGLAR